MKTVLTIAGFDPSSGAGITADSKVFAAHGLFGTSCITAVTVQSTLGVRAVHALPADLVRATLECLQEDLPPSGIKIGMLATADAAGAVADFLAAHPPIPVVLDPVIRSSSGRELLSLEGISVLKERLLPLVTLVTPNLDELALLTGTSIKTDEQLADAARRLQQAVPGLLVLAKGGHLRVPDDMLITADGSIHRMHGERVATRSTHGTGCALSSAVLCNLVRGQDFLPAAMAGKAYVAEALRTAVPMGSGTGPIQHLWPFLRDIVA